MDKVTHAVRREQWTNIINECLASGMNKTAWCKANGISDKSFFYWQRKLREDAYISTVESTSLVPTVRKPNLPAKANVDFVELKMPEQSSATAFHPDIIIRKGNLALEISNTASAELLSRIGGLLHAE